jgi:hypothetical protein
MTPGAILALFTVAATVGVVLWLAIRQWMTGQAPDVPPTILISLLPVGALAASPGIRARLRRFFRKRDRRRRDPWQRRQHRRWGPWD